MHLVYICQHAPVADYKMRKISNVMNSDVIANITRDNPAVGNPNRKLQVMVFQRSLFASAYTNETEKLIVSYLPGVKLVRDRYVIPVLAVVAVLYQQLNLMGSEMPPRLSGLAKLLVAKVILILALGKILRADEPAADAVRRKNFYAIHL
jgi:hypothetical protein